MLRRRRELVVLSAGLQRETIVRRLDHIDRHPLNSVAAFAGSAAALPIAWKLLPMLRLGPVRQVLPFLKLLKFFNRHN